MRILFVTPQAPHPTRGGAAIRNWHLMHAATIAGHIVHLITPDVFRAGLDEPDQSLALPGYRRTIAHRLHDLVLSGEPDLARRLGARRLQAEIARHCRAGAYDLIQVEGLEMWPGIPRTALPILYDAHNAEAILQGRMARQAARDRRFLHAAYSALQSRKLRRYEAGVMRRAATTLAVSPADAAHLRALAPTATVAVVPIGVDSAYYARAAVCTSVPTVDVLFTATFDYRANADAADWFVTRVWPRIRRVRPEARCAFVGRNPGENLRRWNGREGIIVTGSVPDDRPFMAAANVYILPIRFGAGVRVKLLNAMSMGCAIVATPAACEGVDVVANQHIVIAAADPASFAASVLSLLDDPDRRGALGHAARAFVSERYDWSVCTPPLLAVYATLGRDNA
jgi:glycosyltransferase involved in cell wall biosynthesis